MAPVLVLVLAAATTDVLVTTVPGGKVVVNATVVVYTCPLSEVALDERKLSQQKVFVWKARNGEKK